MNLNLARPWGNACSPPQNPEVCFFSRQREDLLFTDEPAIELICQFGRRAMSCRYTLARCGFSTPFLSGVAEPQPANRFRFVFATAKLHPGFYDLRVEFDATDETPVKGVCSFGWKADQMAILETRPADFRKFWDKAVAEVEAIALAPRREQVTRYTGAEIDAYNVAEAALPADYDPQGHRCESVDSAKVSFAGPDGGRIYGWLAKPVGEGPFPAMLVLPGAGFAARPRPLEHARHGYVTLDLQIHGQDVDLPDYPALPGYNDGQVYEPANAYYYYMVHQRVVQAIRYLVSRSDVDASRLAVVGGSQGGRLGIVAAGLSTQVKAVVSAIANAPNQPHIAWAKCCNAAGLDGMDVPGPTDVGPEPAGSCMAYYDPMNFAPDIECPVMLNAGLVDPVSPPYSVWAVYDRLGTADKSLVPLPGLGHDWCPEFDRRAWRWLDQVLGND